MGKRAELFTQLQIDEAILDYLLYTATKALLDKGKSAQFDENTSAPQDAAELTMQMVNSFLDMFHSMHPEYCGGPDLQLRLRLLKFVSLFTSRFLTARLSSAPLLLDTLPGFMALCANSYMNFPTTDLSEVFMKLAADYMVQAAAEEILKSGGTDAGIHRQAFAYGFDNESTADEGSDEFKINAMFFGDDGQLDGWEKIRESHIRALIPPLGASLQDHLKELIDNKVPLDIFEQNLLDFLISMSESQPKPLLVEAELINLQRFVPTEVQTRKFGMNLK